MDHYAVVGNPIAHSKSPEIHAQFAQQTGRTVCYRRLLCSAEDFISTLEKFKRQGGKGLNITSPFKEQAYQWVDQVSERAKLAKAVNTILFKDNGGTSYGDNTDGVGLIRDIVNNHQYSLTGKRLLIIGAGGAARGILFYLLQHKPNEILIANRTLEKAIVLAADFKQYGTVKACRFADDLPYYKFDSIINATSIGLHIPDFSSPDALIAKGGWCYDLSYGEAAQPFLQWAIKQGASAVDGLGMLVEQAAESFRLWHGQDLPLNTQTVIQALLI